MLSKLFESWTVWFNVLVGVATFFWPTLQSHISPEEAGAFVVVGNLLLRIFKTQTAIAPIGGEKF